MDIKSLFENYQKNIVTFVQNSVLLYENQTGVELAVFLGVLRSANMIHQTHHWQTSGKNFYADHLLFERLYNDSVGHIDTVAEKLVGLLSEKETNFFAQVEHMKAFMELVGHGESLVQESLAAEICLILIGEFALERLREQGILTEGLNQAIGNVLDKHEDFIYLLKQRTE